MEDALWKLLGFLLAAILLVAVPTMSLAERQDDITLSVVQAEANRFADTARDMGMISPRMYDRFVERLQATGLRYDIRLRHDRHAWQPVYQTTNTGLDFTGEYERSSVTEGESTILGVLYPDDMAGMEESSRFYRMHVGDQLQVEVRSRGDTLAASWRRMFFSSDNSGMEILARAGGMVRNETD